MAASRSRTWAASRNRNPPYFTNGMRRRRSSTSSRSLWWALRKSTACSPQATPVLVVLENDVGDRRGLGAHVGTGGQDRARDPPASAVHSCLA